MMFIGIHMLCLTITTVTNTTSPDEAGGLGMLMMVGTGGGEEDEFFNHYKNDLERHAHTLSGVAGGDLQSKSSSLFPS
jgi:hypothetical protein